MKLSIIIANRNDIVMLNITLNNCIEMLKGLNYESEIVVVDNSDPKFYEIMPIAYPPGFTKLCNVRVFHRDDPSFTTARMMAAEKARGEYIFCIDSHVLIGFNTFRRSVEFMDEHKDHENLGFGHPPIRWAHQGPCAVRHTLGMGDDGVPWGSWSHGIRKDQKIFWKFMPWICRRDWYLNTLKGYGSHSTHALSWGGAEMLQQLKSWMLGYEQWGIATDPVIHIGPYSPAVVKTGQYKYRTYSASGNLPHGVGVLVAFYVLGGEDAGYAHAKIREKGLLQRHKITVDDWWPKAMELGEEEHEWLMQNKKYDYLEMIEKEPWK